MLAMGPIMAGGFQVTAETVLQMHSVVANEHDRLNQLAMTAMDEPMQRCGDDPVSYDAQAAFEAKVVALRHAVSAHIERLGTQAEELAAAAKSYGFTEQEIAAAVAGPGR